MVYKAPDLGYHTTLLTIPTVTKKKRIIFKKKKQKNNWTKTYTCTIPLYEKVYMINKTPDGIS